MASKDPNSSPSPPPATKTRRPTATKQPKARPNKRKVIRPTEIVSPGEPPERNHGRLQAVEDDDVLGSSDEESVEEMDLSDEEEDEYDDDDEEEEDEEEEDDDDDVESIYLPDPTPKTVLPSQSRSHQTPAHRRNMHAPRQHGTVVETRTQSSQWVVAQQQAPSREMSVRRGGTASRHQTVRREQPPQSTSRERGVARGNNANAFRLNMSLDVNVNFSGLVTGRNLGFAGGQLSYAWGRSRQE